MLGYDDDNHDYDIFGAICYMIWAVIVTVGSDDDGDW